MQAQATALSSAARLWSPFGGAVNVDMLNVCSWYANWERRREHCWGSCSAYLTGFIIRSSRRTAGLHGEIGKMQAQVGQMTRFPQFDALPWLVSRARLGMHIARRKAVLAGFSTRCMRIIQSEGWDKEDAEMEACYQLLLLYCAYIRKCGRCAPFSAAAKTGQSLIHTPPPKKGVWFGSL